MPDRVKTKIDIFFHFCVTQLISADNILIIQCTKSQIFYFICTWKYKKKIPWKVGYFSKIEKDYSYYPDCPNSPKLQILIMNLAVVDLSRYYLSRPSTDDSWQKKFDTEQRAKTILKILFIKVSRPFEFLKKNWTNNNQFLLRPAR